MDPLDFLDIFNEKTSKNKKNLELPDLFTPSIITSSPLLSASTIIGNGMIDGVIDSLLGGNIDKPKKGCVVYCDLAGLEMHSGIYVGKKRIAHLNGDGRIETVSAKEFLARLGGFNPALTIYTSCRNGQPKGSYDAYERAMSMVGKKRNYNLLFDNCHQFTAGCLTGDFKNACNLFALLKLEVSSSLGATEWLAWDY
ncbi:lecithin retinol acyltransferase family protein [Chitinibacter sp. S2-10]|uniref:lecithin retinol acyltransferase family protein n=1 Tax=Chitinibacter sp. S2-10 TaxID=3373597 RepID=UPI003977CCC2